jgi:hypothetical protein
MIMKDLTPTSLLPWVNGFIIVTILSFSAYLVIRFFRISYNGFDLEDTGSKTAKDIAAVEKNIIRALETYHHMAVQLHMTYIVLGALAIICSVFVTTFIAVKGNSYKEWLPYISFTSTAALTLITAFNLGAKGNNCRNGWRHLESAFMSYKADAKFTIEDLIKAKAEAEALLGGVEFQYRANTGADTK